MLQNTPFAKDYRLWCPQAVFHRHPLGITLTLLVVCAGLSHEWDTPLMEHVSMTGALKVRKARIARKLPVVEVNEALTSQLLVIQGDFYWSPMFRDS